MITYNSNTRITAKWKLLWHIKEWAKESSSPSQADMNQTFEIRIAYNMRN